MDEDVYEDIIMFINGEEYTLYVLPPPYAIRNVIITDHSINLVPYNRRGDYFVYVGNQQVGMFCSWLEDTWACSAGPMLFEDSDPNEAVRQAVEFFLTWDRPQVQTVQAEEG